MSRRHFLVSLGAVAMGAALPALPQATEKPRRKLRFASLRGSLDATDFGVRNDTQNDQSREFQAILNRASAQDKPVFLSPGRYVVSNIDLPTNTRLIGISGSSRIVNGGGGQFLTGTGCERVDIEDVAIDGAHRGPDDPLSGALHLKACPNISIDNCEFIDSRTSGLVLESCGGRISNNSISRASGAAAIYSVGGTGLTISHNDVSDCSNGGILVHRWAVGTDDTMVTNNRIRRIAASHGGTGQNGNGINIFRANNVTIAGNHVSDCAFSAIRCNSASNAVITGNSCIGSGETAIYAEFAFTGSIINDNLVDGATIGISIANFREDGRMAACNGNLIRNLSLKGPYPAESAGFGIGIAVEADTNVTGNVIEGAPQYGMLIGWGPYLRNVIAANNIIRRSGTGMAVSVVEGAGKASLTNNLFDEVPNGAIVGHRWKEIASGDLVLNRSNRFANLTVSGNSTI